MSRQLSHSLAVRDRGGGAALCCAACGHALCGADEAWKPYAVSRARAVHELGAVYTTDRRLLLREFCCPGCGALLDAEIALPEDPWLEDRLAPEVTDN